MGKKITEVFVFVTTDEDGDEAMPGFRMKDGSWVAMVSADIKHMESLKPIAQGIANQMSQDIRILRFSQMEVFDVIRTKVSTH